MIDLTGRRVVVVGLGSSGEAAAASLADMGADVAVTELSSTSAIEDRATRLRARGLEVETGGHEMDLSGASLAIVSPGIPMNAPILDTLRSAGIELMSEIELASRLAECDLLAVTGTNGKTTTTSILAAILQEAGIESAAAGNIGWPLIDAVRTVGKGGAIAVEVSSFQLEFVSTFHPKVAVILNVAEDHTDWHGTFENYARAKGRIIENQTADDYFLPNAQDPIAMTIAAGASATVVPFSADGVPDGGIGVAEGNIVWQNREILSVVDVPVPGTAGLEDAAAAAGAALCYGIDAKAVARAIKAFRPLAHRLEVVAEARGVTFIDDSKATNPHATLTAVRGLTDVVLIAGGRSKGIDLSVLVSAAPSVIHVVAMGEAADQIEKVFDGVVPVERAASMEDAVRRAIARSVPGGSVLLSPGCASLDMYENYAARGEAFAGAVRQALAMEGGTDGDA